MTLAFTVLGLPAPQGSMKGFVRGKRAILVHANARTMPWRQDVAAQAQEAVRQAGLLGGLWPISDPVRFDATFYLPRPRSHSGKKGLKPSAPMFPASKPDLSKLVRAVEDALSGIVYDDDSRIVVQHVQKLYADQGRSPRLLLQITALK